MALDPDSTLGPPHQSRCQHDERWIKKWRATGSLRSRLAHKSARKSAPWRRKKNGRLARGPEQKIDGTAQKLEVERVMMSWQNSSCPDERIISEMSVWFQRPPRHLREPIQVPLAQLSRELGSLPTPESSARRRATARFRGRQPVCHRARDGLRSSDEAPHHAPEMGIRLCGAWLAEVGKNLTGQRDGSGKISQDGVCRRVVGRDDMSLRTGPKTTETRETTVPD
ncbi:hypothetical protein GGR56DRAFT_273391 [Xylariaceae sp. FL0804]|nr:hypothetical protein GGR56DRAFT_273391 [Xylariaceae sp. FL0804]